MRKLLMVNVMNEAGIDVSGQESKGVDGYLSACGAGEKTELQLLKSHGTTQRNIS